MGFNSFRVRVLFRVLLMTVLIAVFIYLVDDSSKIVSAVIVGLFTVALIVELFHYLESTNRKLTRFLESVRYSDFISGFSADNQLGKSFKDLNTAFNEVLEAFRKARSEKEEHGQYLNTVVHQIGTGLLSFDTTGNIELINAVAKRYLRTPQIHNISEVREKSETLYRVLTEIKPGANRLFRLDAKHKLAINATELILHGNSYKLITLQNIQPELQQNEVEAWQKLTSVLRHEIMNSITPIASLTSTLKEILIEDLKQINGTFEIGTEAVDDLQEGLNTIEGRSYGLIKFIDAYRDYTSIPEPKKVQINLYELLEHITNLMKIEIRKSKVKFEWTVTPENLYIDADSELMEQVLINLVKNAIEAVGEKQNPEVRLTGCIDKDSQICIKVHDNGQGILPEAQERIFIPFYTTKKNGSGIGLALSRQIMQLHNGTLSVESQPDKYTEFTLKF